MLTYKFLHSLAPQYLTELFTECSEGKGLSLCSSEENLQMPLLGTSIFPNAFVIMKQNYGMSSAEKQS